MIRYLNLLESRAIFHNLQGEKTGIDIGYEKKEFFALLKMKVRRKEFFTLWIGSRKQVKILFSNRRPFTRKEPFLSESIIGAVYYPKDGHVIAPELTKAFAQSASVFPVLIYMNRQSI